MVVNNDYGLAFFIDCMKRGNKHQKSNLSIIGLKVSNEISSHEKYNRLMAEIEKVNSILNIKGKKTYNNNKKTSSKDIVDIEAKIEYKDYNEKDKEKDNEYDDNLFIADSENEKNSQKKEYLKNEYHDKLDTEKVFGSKLQSNNKNSSNQNFQKQRNSFFKNSLNNVNNNAHHYDVQIINSNNVNKNNVNTNNLGNRFLPSPNLLQGTQISNNQYPIYITNPIHQINVFPMFNSNVPFQNTFIFPSNTNQNFIGNQPQKSLIWPVQIVKKGYNDK